MSDGAGDAQAAAGTRRLLPGDSESPKTPSGSADKGCTGGTGAVFSSPLIPHIPESQAGPGQWSLGSPQGPQGPGSPEKNGWAIKPQYPSTIIAASRGRGG